MNQQCRLFTVEWDLMEMFFVSIPMYEYLRKNGIAEDAFVPAYHKKDKSLLAYQLKWTNTLLPDALEDPDYVDKKRCEKCGSVNLVRGKEDFRYKNKYLDMDKITVFADYHGW